MGETKKTKKPLIRAFSAGGVVFRKGHGKLLFLIMKPKGTDRWQLPKGTIDKGESSQETAKREVGEEGGVEVKVLDKLGISQYFFVLNGERIFKTVTYFLMEYLADLEGGHDDEVEEARFTTYEDAVEKLTYKDDKKMVEKGKELIELGIEGNLV